MSTHIRPPKTLLDLVVESDPDSRNPSNVYGIIVDWAEEIIELFLQLQSGLRQAVTSGQLNKPIAVAAIKNALENFRNDLGAFSSYVHPWKPLYKKDADEIHQHISQAIAVLVTTDIPLAKAMELIHIVVIDNTLKLIDERSKDVRAYEEKLAARRAQERNYQREESQMVNQALANFEYKRRDAHNRERTLHIVNH